MISRIDHVSIAVKDQKKAEHFFKNILGAIPGSCGGGIHANYFWQLFSIGDLSRLELISPTGPGSFLDGFLADKKDGGVHHITLQTPDIRKAMAHLEANCIPFFGYNEYQDCLWKEIYIHPRHAFGVLIQISEFEADFWLSDQVKFPAGTRWDVEKTPTGATLKFAHPGGGKVSLDLDRKELKQLMEKLKDAL